MTPMNICQSIRISFAVIGLALATAWAGAQETPQQVTVPFEASKDTLPPVNLRPNTPTTLNLRVKNPGAETLKMVTVKLVQIVENNPRVLAQAQLDKLGPKDDLPVVFPAPKDPKQKIEVSGPPFKVQIWIEAKTPPDTVPVKRDLDLIVREPRDYVKPLVANYDAEKKRLDVTLQADESFTGPHKCPVELHLGAAFKESKKGVYRQILTGPKHAADLFADEVTPVDPGATRGFAFLTIDGYERAFAYPVNLTGGGALNDVRSGKIGVRFGVPRYIRPSAKLPVTVQLDGPLASDYRVDVGLDRTGRKKQFQVMHLPGLRHQKIDLAVSAAGNLICKTSVQDWQVEFDTTGVYGNMWLNVAVLKKNPDTGVYQEVELAASGGASGDWAPVVGEPNSKHLFAQVTQDDSKPKVIALDFPKEWLTGKPLDLRATVGERGEGQAPIQSVVFLRGKVPTDDKLDPKAVLGEAAYDVKSEEWMFPLPAQDKPGELEISVLVTTRTGVKMHKTATIALKAPGASLAKITGRIMRGTLPQPKSSVTLTDEKGKLLDTQKTNAKGEYVFEKVAPGVYFVTSRQAFPAAAGQVRVTVRPGDEAVENVNVRLVAK